MAPTDVMGESRPGRTIVITGDTAPCHATVEAAHGAELLVHDASFAEEEVQRAADTGHSTVGQAAAVAREAEVRMLALVHISSRYHVGKVLEEAREVYEPTVAPRDFDLVEIPFPERGEPVLVPNGARERKGRGGSQAARRGDRIGDRDRLVFLEEVLGGKDRRVLDTEGPQHGRAPGSRRASGPRSPQMTWAG